MYQKPINVSKYRNTFMLQRITNSSFLNQPLGLNIKMMTNQMSGHETAVWFFSLIKSIHALYSNWHVLLGESFASRLTYEVHMSIKQKEQNQKTSLLLRGCSFIARDLIFSFWNTILWFMTKTVLKWFWFIPLCRYYCICSVDFRISMN